MSHAVRLLAGVLTAGLVVLALGVVGVWLVAVAHGLPGPGTAMIAGHVVATGVAVALQRVADRRPDRAGLVAAVGVAAVFLLVGVLFWWL